MYSYAAEWCKHVNTVHGVTMEMAKAQWLAPCKIAGCSESEFATP